MKSEAKYETVKVETPLVENVEKPLHGGPKVFICHLEESEWDRKGSGMRSYAF